MLSKLFSALALRDIHVRNRIVVSPMWQYAARDGYPTDYHLMNLGRYADGGAGLVFQEGTAVERRGCGTTGDLGIWDDAFIEPLSRIVALIKSSGSVAGIQLAHSGRKSRAKKPMEGRGPLDRSDDIADWDEWTPMAPSAVPVQDGLEPPRAMSLQDIDAVKDAYAEAARRAHVIGHEVLEIHAAHGYLLHEFLSPLVNQRTDQYGGDLIGRARMLCEVVEAVRASWPAGKPLFVRLSCVDDAGWEMAHTIALVRRLASLGVDLIDCSSGGLVGSPMVDGRALDYGYQVEYAAEVRRATGVPTMAVGMIIHATQAEAIVAEGQSDLVALGREMIQNPNWPLDAALKVGIEDPYSVVNARSAYWLRKRAETFSELKSSNF